MDDNMDLKSYIYSGVRERLDLSKELEDEEIWELIYRVIAQERENRYLSLQQRESLAREIFASVRKLDILQELIDDEEITEIMINGPKDIFIEKKGHILKSDKRFQSEEKLEDVIQQIVAGCNRVVNESNPIADARLNDGSRVNVVLNPVALNGSTVTIRRFPKTALTMADYISFGSITEEAAAFLQRAVRSGYNIFISGGTGSGKTTLLNILSEYIPSDSRVITIEDSAELQIKGVDNLVRLETRNATREGCEEINLRDLIRTALRMRPEGIKIKKGKLKRNKKSFSVPNTFL